MDQRVAVVTGAGKRVGRVLAEGLVELGWSVVAHVHHAADDAPAGCIKVAADLLEGDSADRILQACPRAPDLLVNNAARFAHDDLASFSVEELDLHMGVNLRAPILLTRAFAGMEGAGDRLIVNILDAKLAAQNPDFLSYTLSKAALASFTELAARVLASRGIRVNAVAPALMLHSGEQSDENFAAAHAFNPLKRGVEPADVLTSIRFLLDSPTITGEVLTLDGGQRFMGLPRDVQFLDLS
mgnify:CR=1 FL=1